MTQDSVEIQGIFGRIFSPFTEVFYLLFRLGFAFIVGLHGFQKAFLLWGFPAAANPDGMGTFVDIAAWVEIISAFLIGLGILTRLGAGAIVVTMIVAYFSVHANNGLWPHQFPGEGGFAAHGGEVPMLWFLIAGIIGILGSRKWGIERHFFGKELL
ncbi:MAG: DoxX family protein [Dehalococcoidia bacterium]|nr:DoxX family protein [Dehalococcoidia bacterium]